MRQSMSVWRERRRHIPRVALRVRQGTRRATGRRNEVDAGVLAGSVATGIARSRQPPAIWRPRDRTAVGRPGDRNTEVAQPAIRPAERRHNVDRADALIIRLHRLESLHVAIRMLPHERDLSAIWRPDR